MRTVFFVLMVSACAILLTGCGPPERADKDNTTPVEPDVRITVQTADRQTYDRVIASHRGEVVLVDYWALWCLICLEKFPTVVQWHETYAEKGLAVVSVSLDDVDDQSEVTAFLKKQRADFDNLLSEYRTGEAMEQFEIEGGIPYYKLYDRTGALRYSFGPDPEKRYTMDDIEQQIEALLAEP